MKKSTPVLLFLALVCMTRAGLLSAADIHITELTDLRHDAELSRSRQLPILVLFSNSTCGYCQAIKDEFLKPMLISGEYDDKVLIRRVEVDTSHSLRGFRGELVFADDLADRYRVDFTPTVLLLDARGRELVPRIIGLDTVEYYGGYLDEAIDRALQSLKSR